MISIRESRYEASKQPCVYFNGFLQVIAKSMWKAWCHFVQVILCAVQLNYLLRKMSRVMAVGCLELKKDMKWSCKNWIRTARVFETYWSLLLREHIEAITSLAFYSADTAHGSVKDLCHVNIALLLCLEFEFSQLCCRGRLLFKYLPQGILHLKSLFSESLRPYWHFPVLRKGL